MVVSRAVLAVVLVGVLAACGAGPTASPPPVTAPTDQPEATRSPAAVASAVSPSPSPSPDPTPTPALKPTSKPTTVPVPPKPSGVKFDEYVRVSDDESTTEITQTVTWQAPRSEGVEIRVYGVTECIARPAKPKPNTAGPCLVVHTPLPASVLTLLATVRAPSGTVSWTWTQGTGCGGPGLASDPDGPAYSAVVLAAYSASGHSIFAIAAPGKWYEPGPNVLIC
jgi:hypothetical protein